MGVTATSLVFLQRRKDSSWRDFRLASVAWAFHPHGAVATVTHRTNASRSVTRVQDAYNFIQITDYNKNSNV